MRVAICDFSGRYIKEKRIKKKERERERKSERIAMTKVEGGHHWCELVRESSASRDQSKETSAV